MYSHWMPYSPNAAGLRAKPARTVNAVDSFTIAGTRYVTVNEQLIKGEYAHTLPNGKVEWRTYSYVAVNAREVSHDAA